ncbi:uncharacterized protein LY89DRAFT_680743 [Mollisia scopiformis]|uniref:Uncharacterized protein n=1 Tax=Mollisia scopiformis TaxID=149040 RepID=A0A194XQQ4_MOLSC|nr:uncharacterized protein LY89DRAFT_680743 [Mollisia scopiformis]KUJ22605.1 hypothetical protein LY89DRAFT_680743 [Mollisia scopiformis]
MAKHYLTILLSNYGNLRMLPLNPHFPYFPFSPPLQPLHHPFSLPLLIHHPQPLNAPHNLLKRPPKFRQKLHRKCIHHKIQILHIM